MIEIFVLDRAPINSKIAGIQNIPFGVNVHAFQTNIKICLYLDLDPTILIAVKFFNLKDQHLLLSKVDHLKAFWNVSELKTKREVRRDVFLLLFVNKNRSIKKGKRTRSKNLVFSHRKFLVF